MTLYQQLCVAERELTLKQIADFGEATWVPLDQDDEYGRRQTMRGDTNIQPPVLFRILVICTESLLFCNCGVNSNFEN